MKLATLTLLLAATLAGPTMAETKFIRARGPIIDATEVTEQGCFSARTCVKHGNVSYEMMGLTAKFPVSNSCSEGLVAEVCFLADGDVLDCDREYIPAYGREIFSTDKTLGRSTVALKAVGSVSIGNADYCMNRYGG